MNLRLLWPLLSLSLLLTACPGGPGTPEAESGVCAQTLMTPEAADPTFGPLDLAAVAGVQPNWSAAHVPGQVLVLGGAGRLSAQGTTALSGVRTQAVVPGVTLAFTPAGESDRAFAARLDAAGVRAQPNFVYRTLAAPNDPGFPGNAGITVNGQNMTQHYLPRIRAAQAWDFLAGCGKTPKAALTAVLDSGVDSTHRDLAGRLLTPRAVNGTSPTDATGHGTASVGLIGAATDNGVGVAGVTWTGQNVLSIRVLDEDGGTTADVTAGLALAVRNGAKVINMSLGGPGNPNDAALTAALTTAAKQAVLVAAAGNTPDEGVYFPASHPDVIAVGALGAGSGLACYSARASVTVPRKLDLVAPGGAGYGACLGATRAQDMLVLAPGGGYVQVAGTSEAAPLVSGVAALMRGANPGLSAQEARARLVGSAQPIGGLPVLNAEAAVRAATR